MIGGRALLICLVILIALTVAFGLRPADRLLADPPGAARAVALVRNRAAEATDTLARLRRTIAPALEAGRQGSALIVAGDDPPGPRLTEAAEILDGATAMDRDLRGRLDALSGAALAAGERVDVEPPATPDELSSIAAQLASTAGAADEFAAMRRTALSAVESVGAALGALDGGDLDATDLALAEAAIHLRDIEGWDVDLATLPIWIDVTRDVVASLGDLSTARRAGDEDAVAAAEARLEQVADSAREADTALRIALDEGGSAVAAAPLARLAELLRRVMATEQALAPLVLEGDR